jgi:recombination protein RecA
MAKEKETKKTIEEVLKELNKEYGIGSIIHGNEKEVFTDVITSGSLGLDIALGVNGIPKKAGKIIEMYGWESSGKSTLAQTIIAKFQQAGEKCLLIDAENSLDEKYATSLGIDLEKLYLMQLDESAGEGAYNKMERLVQTGEIGLVVIDSYNALQPLKIVQGEIGDSTMGLHARMLNQAVMKANTLASKYHTNFLFLGQLREKIGVMYGSPETTQGGNALRFYSHVRLKVTRSVTNDNSTFEGDVKTGNKTSIKVEKNKLGHPFKTCSFNIMYGEGIDKYSELIELAHDYEVLKVYGKSITYLETKHETTVFLQMLKDTPEMFEEIKTKILDKVNAN